MLDKRNLICRNHNRARQSKLGAICSCFCDLLSCTMVVFKLDALAPVPGQPVMERCLLLLPRQRWDCQLPSPLSLPRVAVVKPMVLVCFRKMLYQCPKGWIMIANKALLSHSSPVLHNSSWKIGGCTPCSYVCVSALLGSM